MGLPDGTAEANLHNGFSNLHRILDMASKIFFFFLVFVFFFSVGLFVSRSLYSEDSTVLKILVLLWMVIRFQSESEEVLSRFISTTTHFLKSASLGRVRNLFLRLTFSFSRVK